MGADGLREELAAHVSVAFMSLIGLAVYSGSYSVTMAMGVSAQASPVLEMWVVFSHLASSLACLVLQVLTAGILNCDGCVPHVGTSQVSIFLGIACAATCASAGCCSLLKRRSNAPLRFTDAPPYNKQGACLAPARCAPRTSRLP